MTARLEKIRAIIDKHRKELSLSAFAKTLGIPRQTLFNWYSGYNEPWIKTIKGLPNEKFRKDMLNGLYGGVD